MAKTKIEWCDYTVNPVKGLCPVACPYCYARRMYSNPYFKALYSHKTIVFDPTVFLELKRMKPGSRVFWGSTMELFGKWVEPEWMRLIMEQVRQRPDLTHIFLTKRPENLIKWSPFPPNCHVGVSATNDAMVTHGVVGLSYIDAKVKFLSIEPLLNWDMTKIDLEFTLKHYKINWLIIGQVTPIRESTSPKIEWIAEIVEAADKAGIPVFLKDNLRSLLIPEDCKQPNGLMVDRLWANDKCQLRQESTEMTEKGILSSGLHKHD